MRRSPRNLRIACNHAGLTHFGGVYFFHESLPVLQFRHFLARQLVYPIVLGLDRIETASFLRSNGTFQYLTGLPMLASAFILYSKLWKPARQSTP
jgi:hypothetical protein